MQHAYVFQLIYYLCLHKVTLIKSGLDRWSLLKVKLSVRVPANLHHRACCNVCHLIYLLRVNFYHSLFHFESWGATALFSVHDILHMDMAAKCRNSDFFSCSSDHPLQEKKQENPIIFHFWCPNKWNLDSFFISEILRLTQLLTEQQTADCIWIDRIMDPLKSDQLREL